MHRFQFQIGAIGSRDGFSISVAAAVSIPDWCDWQLCSETGKDKRSLFQFQIGAIGSSF